MARILIRITRFKEILPVEALCRKRADFLSGRPRSFGAPFEFRNKRGGRVSGAKPPVGEAFQRSFASEVTEEISPRK